MFGLAGSLLLHGLFSGRGKQELLSTCGVWASHCGGISLQSAGSRALGRQTRGTCLSSCGSQALEHRLRSRGSGA